MRGFFLTKFRAALFRLSVACAAYGGGLPQILWNGQSKFFHFCLFNGKGKKSFFLCASCVGRGEESLFYSARCNEVLRLVFYGGAPKIFFVGKRCVKYVWASYERFLLGRAILKIISRDAKLNGLKLPKNDFPAFYTF